ncbi:hypothetical protein [Serratia ureilytica]|uniref:hypothetical protein n=1 Tax=Serratia ureilytica TaxID=300181 RepID=UPI00254B44B3|nr:hypothetical protein [Serratia ureilytica]
MPTKHIDDSTAAELDELYVRCVTLTQQPVKEVEVLRLAIYKGIRNIADDDILSTMSVKDTVWQGLADTVWIEITAHWPAEGIDDQSFSQVAAEHSSTWRAHPAEKCQTNIRKALDNGRIQERTLDERLFEYVDVTSDTTYSRYSKAEIAQKMDEYKDAVAPLNGKKLSEVKEENQRNFLMLQTLNKQGVSLQPDGAGDFTICLTEAPADE